MVDDSKDPDATSENVITRKRRISKKDRKNLKKKKPDSDLPAKEEEQEAIDFMQSYKNIAIPDKASKEIITSKGESDKTSNEDLEGGNTGKSLGKWFPNALLVKCSVTFTNTNTLLTNGTVKDIDESKSKNPKASLVLFYQYTEKTKKWSPDKVKILMTYLSTIAKKRNIGGRIRVAQEGVNATLSAVDMPTLSGVTAYEALRHVVEDLKNFDPIFKETDFKIIDDLPADRHFKELRVIPVEELVFYGIREEDAACGEGGVHLDAIKYHEMLKKKNTVVIDVRNHYEAVIGRFDGQEKSKSNSKSKPKEGDEKDETEKTRSGAEYIDPKMRKSTDFTQWLAKDETKEKLKDKTVLMFCTGGIRCERASAYLKKEMGSEVGGIYQLQGGVEGYLKAFPDGGFWRGKNFVFDKREAVSAGDKNGDGGIIRKKKGKDKSSADGDLPANCCVCEKKWDRYIGKKKCYTCGVPVLMCEKCMSLKPDKTKGMELKVRCPLCIEENITVPASEVEFTDNGVKNKKKNGVEADGKKGKAADSVLKWGGGHAKTKKLQRKAQKRVCQFASQCARKDCMFYHPERDSQVS